MAISTSATSPLVGVQDVQRRGNQPPMLQLQPNDATISGDFMHVPNGSPGDERAETIVVKEHLSFQNPFPSPAMRSILSLLLLILFLFLQTGSANAAPARQAGARPVRVFFLTGGPVDTFSHDTSDAVRRQVLADAQELKVPVTYKRVWFMNWGSVCKQIQAMKGKDKVVVIGHSWGAHGAVQASKYLNKKSTPIDLLVTIDTIPVPGMGRWGSIPPNVHLNYNFYETSDMFLHSCHHNRRVGADSAEGATEEGVHNIHVKTGLTASPHLYVDNKLIPLIAFQVRMLMLGQLDRLHLPEVLDGTKIGDAEKLQSLVY